jgi:Lipopolysaccharide-assembly
MKKHFLLKRIPALYWVVALLPILGLYACHIYSFTGASIDPNVKSVSIHFFPNQAQKINPALSQQFTEALRDKFTKETALQMQEKNGDLEFNGAITDYSITSLGRQGNQAAANQLSISVRVDFVNHKKETDQWSNTFTKVATFESSQSLAAVENDLVIQINKLLVDEIFIKAVVNW